MDQDTPGGTIVYTLLDIADKSFRRPSSSTPAISQAGPSRLLESIDFDSPQPCEVKDAVGRRQEETPRGALPEVLSRGTSGDRNRLPMKPNKFDGTGSWSLFSLSSTFAPGIVAGRHRRKWTSCAALSRRPPLHSFGISVHATMSPMNNW